MKLKLSRNGKNSLCCLLINIGISCPSREFLTSQICLLMLFAKIKFSRKFANLQYTATTLCLSLTHAEALSSTGSILSNTDLSDLSTVGTCDIFVYQMRHRVMWFARLADSILFIKRVITCHWNGFYENAMRRVFSKIQYDQSMAEYRNTYHCYGLATQSD